MNASLRILISLLMAFAFIGGLAQADEQGEKGGQAHPKLEAAEWEAEMKIATDMQRDATEIRNRVKELRKKLIPLEEEAQAEELATIEKIEAKEKELFTMVAKRMDRLSQQTDDVKLSALCSLRAGQNYMRAEKYAEATQYFDKLAINKELEAELRAQALYWNALSHERMILMDDAKRLYKAITFEFPDSKWAKYARGRLTDPVFH